LLKLPYTVAGEANLARSLDRNAELQLVLNKKDYKIGEEIELQIKAPYQGAGLISIERDGVYQFKWFKTDTSSTVQKIKVPEGLSGNAYVSVTFLRAIDSKEIFMSPLSYAVAPFSISLDDRKIAITLGAPEKVKPGQKLKIEYSTNQPTDIILYGVDEGILQVAQYKLPDPLGFFFQKRALQVKTYQMLDLLMPEFSLIQQAQATGGDEGYGAAGKNLNPFRSKRAAPVAFWSGVIKADSKVRSYTYDVPDYFNGNIKVMAVAANSKNLGAQQNSSFVRGDFIITPTPPIFVAPLDQFKVGLTISNQKEKSGSKAQVKLSVKTNKLLDVTGNAEQTLEIGEGHEAATTVSFQTVNNVGEGQIVFEAQHDNTRAIAKADISVRPAVPYQNLLQANYTDSSKLELTEKANFFEPYSKHTLSISYSPLSIGVGLQAYLEAFPYGCTEQLISRTWPSVLLTSYRKTKNNQLQLKQVEKQKENLKSITRVLRSRQATDGGFSLYEKAGAVSFQAASLYAIQFLIELHDKKLIDVTDMLQKARPYLQRIQSAENGQAIENYRAWAQALYLSARLKIVNGASLTALRQELKTHFKDGWLKDPTAFFLAATYKLYKQDEEAESLFRKFNVGDAYSPVQNDYQQSYFDQLSRDATLIYLAALYAGDSYKKITEVDQLKKMLTAVSNNQYQTFSAAQMMMAFEAMEQRGRAQPALVAELKALVNAKWQVIESESLLAPLTWTIPIDVNQLQLSTAVKDPIFYAYQKSGFANSAELKEVKKNIEIVRQYKNAEGQDVKSVKLGDEVKVTLALRTTDEKAHAHVAIVDLLPGGFELIPQKDLNRLDSGNSEFNVETEQSSEPIDGEPVEQESETEEGAFFTLFIPKVYAQNTKTSLKSLYTDFIDQREDRIVVYATLLPEVTSFEYTMKAVAEGKFRIPSTFAEGMYNHELRFVGPSGWIEVKSEK
jgi:alpha-2-macroglobulin